ncbi:MAG: 2Fe-2S iron-sulfur cluster-binding protein, partial [Pseudohongiellaceae bacterium]
MAKITVDGKVFEVNPQNNLLEEILSHQQDLPYFCWHPAMGSVGSCRQCAIIEYANDEDQRGRQVMACMTSPRDGARYSIEKAATFRAQAIESIMTKHPHDCPVCEEGGECHLQDMTVMSGHSYRRYDGKKVTHTNQYLGPFIGHEMNRCITCYRCVRFYKDYAGGTDFGPQASHNHTYFGRFQEGPLESEFSGNLAEVCPTGVFTDKVFSKHYSRKWDLQTAPSICASCSVGCNINPGERYGTLRRVVNRFNDEVNGYFICDKGRFG